ncbi:MAG TPA: ferredoxin [Actinomycetes bacterium]|jgi:ferredoxin|nr:ferredoxin [Actinomycetes bacterium]
MRVRVDSDRCQGHNRCRALAPQVFDVDELGYSFVIADPVPPELRERALLAVRNCPERAISMEEDEPAGSACRS